MTRRKKIILWIAAPPALLMAACVILIYLSMTDESPPDTSDLAVGWTEIDPDKNAATYLDAAKTLAAWNNDPALPAEYADWPQDVIDKTLADNAAALEQLDKALACRDLEAPRLRDMTANLTYAFDWMGVIRAGLLRAADRFKKGEEARAVDDTVAILRLTHRMEVGKGCLIHLMVAWFVRNTAEDQLRTFALRSRHLDADRLKHLAAEIGDCPVRREDLAATWRAEYDLTAGTIDALAAGRLSGPAAQGLAKVCGISLKFTGPYWLHANATKRLFAGATRTRIAETALPWPESQQAVDRWLADLKSERDAPGIRRNFPSPNRTGRALYYNFGPGIAGVQRRFTDVSAEHGMTQLIVALKACQVDKGDWPEKAEHLVPTYLNSLPIDDFGGKPLRYSRDKKIVYSVGRDGKDEGGMTREEMRAWAKENHASFFDENDPASLPLLWDVPDPSLPIE